MNRLIDKMDTITAINDYYDMAKYKGVEFTEKQLLNAIIGIITSQPTAYDVEAVVSELSSHKWLNIYEPLHLWYNAAMLVAIEIVKRGGQAGEGE